MKIISLLLLSIIACTFSFAQTISISGTVKSQDGRPVPVAFVRDAQHYYATYADSSGVFALKADPGSTLTIVADNYNDVSVKIDNKTHIDVVMTKGKPTAAGNSGRSKDDIGSGNTLGFITKLDLGAQGNSQTIKVGFSQEPTHGSPYEFTSWLHGFAIGAGDSLLYEIDNLYNFDKLTGNLVFTKDNNTIMQVNTGGVKYFGLYNGKKYPLVFTSAPAINNMPFAEVLLSTPRYKIYKRIDCHLERANFHTDGVIETGHRYDEYQDVVKYYFVKLPDGKPQSMSLKKSALKKYLEGSADKFIDAQGSRDIDEDYVRELSYVLNQ